MPNRRKYNPVVGERYGRGTVLAVHEGAERGDGKVSRELTMLCDCGARYTSLLHNVCKGATQSCGCLSRERSSEVGRSQAKNPWPAVGERFGSGVVTQTEFRNSTKVRAATLLCDCGKFYQASLKELYRADTKARRSCGCKTGSRAGKQNVTHGLSTHYLYSTYLQMIKRCTDPGNAKFADYGGRGITVATEWQRDSAGEGLRRFLAYVDTVLGHRPVGMSLDRIDNDGPYAPGNIRWATASQQVRNRRKFAGQVHKLKIKVAQLEAENIELRAKLAKFCAP